MTQKYKLFIWLAIIVTAVLSMQQLVSHYSWPEIQQLMLDFEIPILIAYVILLSLRGVLFVPTMPFIVLMAYSFNPWLVFFVTLLASTTSAWVVCIAVDRFGFAEKAAKISVKHHASAQAALDKYGFFAVFIWALTPITYTEFIVYLARIGSLSRSQIVGAVMLGEGGLIVLIIKLTDLFKALVLS